MKSILISIIAGLFGAITFNVIHNEIYGTKMGVVRLDELLAEHVTKIGKETHTEDELKELSVKYSNALDLVMGEYRQKRIVLFVDQAIVSEMPDYTDEIRTKMDALMEVKKK